jgi:hypothetical protein
MRNTYRILHGKPEGKRPHGRPMCWWEDNIKMHLKKVGCEGMGWILLTHNSVYWWAVVNMVMNLWVL